MDPTVVWAEDPPEWMYAAAHAFGAYVDAVKPDSVRRVKISWSVDERMEKMQDAVSHRLQNSSYNPLSSAMHIELVPEQPVVKLWARPLIVCPCLERLLRRYPQTFPILQCVGLGLFVASCLDVDEVMVNAEIYTGVAGHVALNMSRAAYNWALAALAVLVILLCFMRMPWGLVRESSYSFDTLMLLVSGAQLHGGIAYWRLRLMENSSRGLSATWAASLTSVSVCSVGLIYCVCCLDSLRIPRCQKVLVTALALVWNISIYIRSNYLQYPNWGNEEVCHWAHCITLRDLVFSGAISQILFLMKILHGYATGHRYAVIKGWCTEALQFVPIVTYNSTLSSITAPTDSETLEALSESHANATTEAITADGESLGKDEKLSSSPEAKMQSNAGSCFKGVVPANFIGSSTRVTL